MTHVSNNVQQPALTSVSRKEWRWVIIFGGLLVALTLLPYAWAFSGSAPAGTRFMGILYNPLDGASYFAKMRQGQAGEWLFHLAYTPEPHDGAFLQVFYLALGQVARLLDISTPVMFHIARVVTSFMMFIAIYHLGSTIWSRIRPRRLFFGMLAVGSGLGWLLMIFTRDFKNLSTDLLIPESIPLYATFVNPHFPLSIALIALLAATFVAVLRPGFTAFPSLANGGLAVALVSVALALVQPQGWAPFGATLCVYIAILTVRSRQIPRRELFWALVMILPALPVLVYDLAVINSNWAMRIWNEQNQTPSPTVDKYLFGFGLLLVVAIPGIWRGLRRFERDGDRLMVVWLVVNALLLYAPFNLQRRLTIGLIIPIVYFGVRALEDYWFQRIRPRWRDAALLTFFVFIVPSNALNYVVPLAGITNVAWGLEGKLLLPSGYAQAIDWLQSNGEAGEVVLAMPAPSLWIPAYTDLRVVYGHPYETLHAEARVNAVTDWYRGLGDCRGLIETEHVRYVLARPAPEGDLATAWPTACLTALGEMPGAMRHEFGDALLLELP
ncbi:MAG: hypothetical protein IT323_07060 [Anaerolineae bacterium]|nr:hypothetical protein [Anaerolineae bacterium]